MSRWKKLQTADLPKNEVIDGYCNSLDFAIAYNTTRMIYRYANGSGSMGCKDLLAHTKACGERGEAAIFAGRVYCINTVAIGAWV